MTIQIDDTYSLEQEPISPVHFNVMEKSIVKDEKAKHFGKETIKPIAYGLTLPAAVHFVIMKKSLDRDTIVNIEKWVTIYENAVKKLTEKLTEHGSKS